MNIRDVEGFGIQADRSRRSAGNFLIQALCNPGFPAIGNVHIDLEVFRKIQEYSSSRNRLDSNQLTQGDERHLPFSGSNLEKSVFHAGAMLTESGEFGRE